MVLVKDLMANRIKLFPRPTKKSIPNELDRGDAKLQDPLEDIGNYYWSIWRMHKFGVSQKIIEDLEFMTLQFEGIIKDEICQIIFLPGREIFQKYEALAKFLQFQDATQYRKTRESARHWCAQRQFPEGWLPGSYEEERKDLD
jgi:hypothetical protein